MGFRKEAIATVWEVTPMSNTFTKGRISISRKDKSTGEYVQDFGGFVSFIGTACAQKALSLRAKDRIRLGDVDVSNRYDKERNTTYTNFNIFSFEMADAPQAATQQPADTQSYEPEDNLSDDLPF